MSTCHIKIIQDHRQGVDPDYLIISLSQDNGNLNWAYTLSSIRGESSANHVSCLSDWQWAKQEFMNSPVWDELEKSLMSPSIWFLKSASKKRDDMLQKKSDNCRCTLIDVNYSR